MLTVLLCMVKYSPSNASHSTPESRGKLEKVNVAHKSMPEGFHGGTAQHPWSIVGAWLLFHHSQNAFSIRIRRSHQGHS